MFSGENLKTLREQKNLSQKVLGEELDVSDTMISMYEQNKKQPSLPTITKMAKFFNVSVDYLIGLKDDQDDKDDIPENIKAVARNLMDLPEANRKLAIDMIDYMSNTGKEAKNK